MEIKHIFQVLDIANQELGRDYLEYQYVVDCVNNPTGRVCKVVQDSQNKIIGFCLCKIVSPTELIGRRTSSRLYTVSSTNWSNKDRWSKEAVPKTGNWISSSERMLHRYN